MNGVGDGGSAITVDGSSAQTNPENRGFGNYGGQNQIEILSVEAVGEVQVAKGVLAAESGGSIGGQVNVVARSGTNQFHGSLFENFQSDAFSSRDPFLPPTTAKPEIRFNRFGGSIGGPIMQNRVLFFGSYEGYREESGVTVQGNVATQATRDRMLASLPYPETKIVLDNMPLPNVPVDALIGRYTDARTLDPARQHVPGKSGLRGWRGQIVGDRIPDAAVRLRSANPDQQRSAVHERLEAPLDQLRADEQFVGLRKPVRLESQYARSLRRVLARGIAHPRVAGGPLQRAQADLDLQCDGLVRQRRYRNPRLDLRRLQPRPEGHPLIGTPTR